MLTQVELLKKYNLRIRGHLGQHLLMDPNTIRKIVDALDLKPGERVLEIGPGLGAVTQEILKRGFSLLAVEKDRKFVEILQTELAPAYAGKFTLVHGDILENNLTKTLQEWAGQGPKVKAVSNLPYYISTPILFHLIEHAKNFSKAVLMLQKEVAARLTAKPGEDDYGRLSVTTRFYGETKFLFDVSPACFLPRPEVMSRVIAFTFRSFAPGISTVCEKKFLELVQIAFSQRRKTLLSLLTNGFKPRKNRKDLERIFQDLGFALNARGETLSLEEFLSLSGRLEAV